MKKIHYYSQLFTSLLILAAVLAAPSRSAAVRLQQWALVERFDTESYSDFSAQRSNFIGLVLFCIDAKFCKKNIRWKALDEIYKIYFFYARSFNEVGKTGKRKTKIEK